MKCNNPNCVKDAIVQCFIPCAGHNADVVYYCVGCAKELGYCIVCGNSKYSKKSIDCSECGPAISNILSIVDFLILRDN